MVIIKYKLVIIYMFFLFIIFFSRVNAEYRDLPLLGKTIYLDAGHGGIDVGAISGKVYEKDLNLELVKILKRKLEEKGALVYLTRNGDYDIANKNVANRKRSDLTKRAIIINNSDADLYLSIHLNATNKSKWRGLQIFYTTKNEENVKIAEVISDTIKKKISTVRDIKKDNSYYMYKQIKKPGVLIEAGFISNPSDLYLLRREWYQNKLMGLIRDGVIEYMKKDSD